MAADGKEVHTESPRVLLPGYYRAGNSGSRLLSANPQHAAPHGATPTS
jgi:hypothetical protein